MATKIAPSSVAGGLPSEAVDGPQFDRFDADKMGFNCVVGLPLAVHGVTLGEYLAHDLDEARTVFDEAVDICSTAIGADRDGDAHAHAAPNPGHRPRP